MSDKPKPESYLPHGYDPKMTYTVAGYNPRAPRLFKWERPPIKGN